MIEQLRIQHLGVIAEATLELGAGFTVITGETGAGKTMVVTALNLLMGQRADASAVRSGADAARVGGVVHVSDEQVIERVEDIGGVIEDGELMLTRTVSAEGRSRASVGAAAAPISALAEISQSLFVVHGQSDQLRLRSASAQRDMLDRFGGQRLLEVRNAYQRTFRERTSVEQHLVELTTQRDAREAEARTLLEQLESISAVDPQPDEDIELKQRIEVLSNSEQLRAATAAALAALSSEAENPMSSDAQQLVDLAIRELERATNSDARLSSIVDSLQVASMQIAESARELSRYAADLDLGGPAELAEANERLASINQLLRQFGDTTQEVIDYGERSAKRLTELEGDDETIVRLSEQLESLRQSESELARQLTQLRINAAKQLDEQVTRELRQLALPDAQLLTQVTDSSPSIHGCDSVTLMLSPHPGADPRPIAKGASGGELSRVMLAIEVVVAQVDPVATFVFDEVDAGVGGAAAIEIGRRLSRLARTAQVIVVTHLAQVAAFANNHITVVKDSTGGFTQSSCQTLSESEKLTEIARLLSGLSDSESALTHAAELVQMGEREHAGAHPADNVST